MTQTDASAPTSRRRTGDRRRMLLIAAALGLAIALSVAVWGVPVPSLNEYVLAAARRAVPDVDLEIGGAAVTVRGFPSRLTVRLDDVRVRRGDGLAAEIDSAWLGLSTRTLLGGAVAVRAIGINGGRAHFAGPDLMTAKTAPPAEPQTPGLEAALAAIIGPPGGLPLQLAVVWVRNAEVVVEDTTTGHRGAARGQVDLRRRDDHLEVSTVLSIDLGGRASAVEGRARYRVGSDTIGLSGFVRGFDLLQLSSVWPALDELPHPHCEWTGGLEGEVGLNGAVEHLDFEGTCGSGTLVASKWYAAPLDLRSAAVRGTLKAEALEIAEMRVATASAGAASGPQMSGSGAITWGGERVRVALDLRATGLQVAEIGRYWPEAVAGGARKWATTRISGGRVSDLALRFAAAMPHRSGAPPVINECRGRLRFEGLTVEYLDDSPPATALAGDAAFDCTALRFQVSSGAVGELQLSPAAVRIEGLDGTEERLHVQAEARGPSRALIEWLATRRVDLIETLGIDPDAPEPATVRASIDLPLRSGLRRSDVSLDVAGSVSAVRMNTALVHGPLTGDWHLTQEPGGAGMLDLDIDLRAAELALPGRAASALADAARAQVTIELVELRPRALKSFEVAHSQLQTRGSGRFASSAPGLESLSFASLRLGGVALAGVEVQWQGETVVARMGTARLQVQPRGDQRYELQLAVPNLETTARDLGVSDRIRGGRLEVTGDVDSSGSKGLFRGQLDARDVLVSRASILYRLMQAASLDKLETSLGEGWLRVERLTGGLTIDGARVRTERLRGHTPALGFTVEGWVDVAATTVDVKGTIMPVSTARNLVAKIPLGGRLLFGREGDRFLAVDYRVHGTVADPTIAVNPLNAVAPGFVQELFEAVVPSHPKP